VRQRPSRIVPGRNKWLAARRQLVETDDVAWRAASRRIGSFEPSKVRGPSRSGFPRNSRGRPWNASLGHGSPGCHARKPQHRGRPVPGFGVPKARGGPGPGDGSGGPPDGPVLPGKKPCPGGPARKRATNGGPQAADQKTVGPGNARPCRRGSRGMVSLLKRTAGFACGGEISRSSIIDRVSASRISGTF